MTALAAHDPRFTATEFERIARRGGFGDARLELRDGEIVKLSPQHLPHALAKTCFYDALKDAIAATDLGLRVMQEVSLALGDYFQPLPDVVVWDPAVLGERLQGPMPGEAVRLVIEVSDSTLADDLGAKLGSYAASGVTEYWVVDLKAAQLLAHAEPGGETYARRVPHVFGDRIEALTLPLSIDTSALIERP